MSLASLSLSTLFIRPASGELQARGAAVILAEPAAVSERERAAYGYTHREREGLYTVDGGGRLLFLFSSGISDALFRAVCVVVVVVEGFDVRGLIATAERVYGRIVVWWSSPAAK